MQAEECNYVSAAVRILNGKYKDAILKIAPGEKLVIGRDVNECHLVLEAPWVSRKHCVISYNYEQRTYEVVDYSENGIFIQGERRLEKQVVESLSSGTVITIGEEGVAMQLL